MTPQPISRDSLPESPPADDRSARGHGAAELSRQALVHELQVHQVELEQQNEELRQTQADLAAARDLFVDLFDFAPVSYLTLDPDGCVLEANLTAAAEFGLERATLLGSQFLRFVATPDSDRWQRLKASALRRADVRRIELMLRRQDGRHFHAQLDCLRVVRADSKAQLRLTLTDVSQRKLAETNQRIATSGSMARESERRRVAHRLHEDLGQRLGALKMRLESLALPEGADANRAIAESMAGELDQALAVVRRMSSDLHPLILDNLGLNAALDWLAHDVAARLGLAVELHLDDDTTLDDDTAIAIYRLVETALGQLAQRVSAGISVEMLQRPQDVVLQFQGEPGHVRFPGAGVLAGELTEALKDQVHLLGGRLEFSELAGAIWRVSVFVPAQPRRSGRRQ
jgi:PAS domain S-box-containing protein